MQLQEHSIVPDTMLWESIDFFTFCSLINLDFIMFCSKFNYCNQESIFSEKNRGSRWGTKKGSRRGYRRGSKRGPKGDPCQSRLTISVENCTNTGAEVFVLLCANCCTNCSYHFLNVRTCNRLKFGKMSRKDLLCMKM